MLYKRRVRDALNLKVFVDVDSDVRLARQGEKERHDSDHSRSMLKRPQSSGT